MFEQENVMAKTDYRSIDEYISAFPPGTQKKLEEMRRIISSASPHAVEKISYQIPTFFLFGNLVHFAGYERHIGFYPTPDGISRFKSELKSYKSAKGSVQFPLTEPLPVDTISSIVKFRVEENTRRALERKRKRNTRRR